MWGGWLRFSLLVLLGGLRLGEGVRGFSFWARGVGLRTVGMADQVYSDWFRVWRVAGM